MIKRVLFDTSVLIPAIWEGHPNHKSSLFWLSKGYQGHFNWAVPAHCLAEIYAGLTVIPSSPQIKPINASQAIDDLLQKANIIELSAKDYQRAIEKCVMANLRSGVIYDALIAVAAEIFEADCLLTYNKHDFSRILGKQASIIKTP